MRKYLSILLLILIFQGCSLKKDYILFNKSNILKKSANNTSTIHKNIKFEYKIVPHDRVSVIVYQHPDLSTTTPAMATQDRGVLVDGEGVLSLPLLEDVNISGLTQKEASLKIALGYDKYLNYSKVRIEVLNKRVYVIGEVSRPGEFSLDNEQITLLQALAKAGDFTDTANRQQILVIRSQHNSAKTFMIDLTDINSITHAGLMIQPNDIVYVLPTNMKAINTNIESISPLFRIIATVLSTYISFDYITNK